MMGVFGFKKIMTSGGAGSVPSDEINGTTRRSSLHKPHSFHNLQLHGVHEDVVNVKLDTIIAERPTIVRPG
jgi:hypothetical protein